MAAGKTKAAKKKTGRKPRTKASKKALAKASPKKKGKKNQAPNITAQTYNKLWAAYTHQQNISYAAREAGVSNQTAAHYITGTAHPESGMEPIRARWLRVTARAQQEEELDLLTFKRRERKQALRQLRAMHAEMELAVADVFSRLKKYKAGKGSLAPKREMALKDLVVAYDKAVRLVEHLLGGPDVTVAGLLVNDPLATLTEAEALVYATTGRLPAAVAQVLDAEFEVDEGEAATGTE